MLRQLDPAVTSARQRAADDMAAQLIAEEAKEIALSARRKSRAKSRRIKHKAAAAHARGTISDHPPSNHPASADVSADSLHPRSQQARFSRWARPIGTHGSLKCAFLPKSQHCARLPPLWPQRSPLRARGIGKIWCVFGSGVSCVCAPDTALRASGSTGQRNIRDRVVSVMCVMFSETEQYVKHQEPICRVGRRNHLLCI